MASWAHQVQPLNGIVMVTAEERMSDHSIDYSRGPVVCLFLVLQAIFIAAQRGRHEVVGLVLAYGLRVHQNSALHGDNMDR